MKRIEAPTLNEALLKASESLAVSVCDIEYEIVQEPSKGFLGFGKKEAIIVASVKTKEQQSDDHFKKHHIKANSHTTVPIQSAQSLKQPIKTQEHISEQIKPQAVKTNPHPTTPIESTQSLAPTQTLTSENAIYDNFFQDHHSSPIPNKETSTQALKAHENKNDLKQLNEIALSVEQEIQELFALTPFKIDSITVNVFDEQTLFIKFQGEDSALLIGKEGYRYKALSYMLFNWINAKYGLMLRLEIAEFLQNQEEMIQSYLAPIIQSIHETGRGQTRSLNGVLAYIALRQLRETFPNKYVSFRNTPEGEKYVIVNDFIRNHPL